MSNLKYRILVILGLVAVSIWALFPRTVVERVNRGGQFVYDTVQRVPLKRGLDLQGGMHIALEIDESKGTVQDKKKAIEQAKRVIENRINEFGVSEPVVQVAGNDRIIVELPGIEDEKRATDVVAKAAFLQFQITDETGALERTIPRLDAILKEKGLGAAPATKAATPAATPGVGGLFGDTANKAAVAAAGGDSAKRAAGDSAKADSASLLNDRTGPFARAIQGGQMPGQYFIAVSDVPSLERYLSMPDIQGALPPGKEALWGTDSLSLGNQWYRPLYVVDANPIITGEYLIDAKPASDPVEGNIVQFTLNNEGGRRFKNQTAKHIKDNMAIVLDDRVVTAPVLQSAIGSRGQITLGGGTLQEAQDLALVLRAGALPVQLKAAEVRKIGASLGQDSINRGITAGLIAVALVVLIMTVYYKFSGLLAVGALALYVLFTLAMLAGFGAVLTLPGIAGLVLSVGIAVDANVLIFERIREELERGKTVRTSIDEGFRHALSAIIDSSVATILSSAVLYQYGSGPIRGFAVTLIAGLVASLFTAIFVVRTFYLIWLNRSRGAQTLSI